jgi:hypothetical protein
MSSLDISLSLNGIERRAVVGSSTTPLRIVLCAGETIRLPRRAARITVLSGTAWVTEGGRDLVLASGGSVEIGAAADSPIISAVGTEALLLEL